MTGQNKTLKELIEIWKVCSTTNERGCWLWQGKLNTNGYVNVKYRGCIWKLHKLVWEHFNGPVPDGLELDHLCRLKNCWNPSDEHLEPVTHKVNCQRGNAGKNSTIGQFWKSKTHCPSGHEYNEENTKAWRGKRYCRACHRLGNAQYATRRKNGCVGKIGRPKNAEIILTHGD